MPRRLDATINHPTLHTCYARLDWRVPTPDSACRFRDLGRTLATGSILHPTFFVVPHPTSGGGALPLQLGA